MATELADYLFALYRRAYSREPNEYEMSYQLHRVLIGGVSRATVEADVLRGGDEEFVQRAWERSRTGQVPGAEEMAAGMALCAVGRAGRDALVRQLAVDSKGASTAAELVVDVMSLDGLAFLRTAWWRLAGREPTPVEVAEADARLRSGEWTKRELLIRLGAVMPESEKRWEWRVIGPLLRVLDVLPKVERAVDGLRYRVADLESGQNHESGG